MPYLRPPIQPQRLRPLDSIEAPAWMEAYEREEWERLVPELAARGVAKAVHRGLLEGVCVLYAQARRARDEGDAEELRLSGDAYLEALRDFGLPLAAASPAVRPLAIVR